MEERPTLVMVDGACFVNSPQPIGQHKPCRVLYWNSVGQPYVQRLDIPHDPGMFARFWRPATTYEFMAMKAQWEDQHLTSED